MSKTLFKSMQSVKVLIIRRMGRGRKEERQIKGMWRKEMRGEGEEEGKDA